MKKILSVSMTIIIMITLTACETEVNISKKDEFETVVVTRELTEEESDELLSTTDLLPVGTVVELDGFDNKVMIIGLIQFLEEKSVLYDYSGVIYPIGYMDAESNYLFNKDQITRIYYYGYVDEEQQTFQDFVNDRKAEYYESQKNSD